MAGSIGPSAWRFSLILDRARMLMRQRGEADALPAEALASHLRRLEILVGR